MNEAIPEKLERRQRSRPAEPWSPTSTWPSTIVSFVFHLILFLTLAIVWRSSVKGTGGEKDRPVGIAVIHQQRGQTEYFLNDSSNSDNAGSDSSASPKSIADALNTSASSAANAVTTEALLGEFASALNGDLGQVAGIDGQGASLSGSNDAGIGTGRPGGSKTQTKVFGIEGSGNSFVYVFDRSDSMNGYEGAPLRYAKKEMVGSIETLKSINQFQIVFYNEAPSPYRGSLSRTSQLIFATDSEKRAAIDFVRRMTGSGGTEHLPALKLAMNLSSDIIFFLTDAADPPLRYDDINFIVERCRGQRTTIHSIEFGIGPSQGSDRWIERLAKLTGGQYRYLDLVQLDR